MKKYLSILATVAAMSAPQASVTCQRQLIPETTVEFEANGFGVRSGGGKTVVTGGLPYGLNVGAD